MARIILLRFMARSAVSAVLEESAVLLAAPLYAALMTGAYLALTGLAGLGIGAILRHGAAAVGVLVGGLFVLPLITGAASRATGKFMPELIAGNSLAAVKPVAGFTWSPWLELGIVGSDERTRLIRDRK